MSPSLELPGRLDVPSLEETTQKPLKFSFFAI